MSMLLEAGADVDAVDETGLTALHWAACQNKNAVCVCMGMCVCSCVFVGVCQYVYICICKVKCFATSFELQ